MREIRTYGSEGGGTLTRPPYPYWLDTRSLAVGALIGPLPARRERLGVPSGYQPRANS